MNKSLALIPLVFAIFALMVSPAVMSAYAGTENNGRDQGTKTANGCDNGQGQADPPKNPNCTDTGGGDPTPVNVCDTLEPYGELNSEEISDFTGVPESTTQAWIDNAESDHSSGSENLVIDTSAELRHINGVIDDSGYTKCGSKL